MGSRAGILLIYQNRRREKKIEIINGKESLCVVGIIQKSHITIYIYIYTFTRLLHFTAIAQIHQKIHQTMFSNVFI